SLSAGNLISVLPGGDMLEAVENSDDEGVANVGIWPGYHALNTPRNHLAYL
ncbi:hypothetical protein A2U01_0112451, partial [Trifolium medium]|nr:hypothetical protein [Trifolium medium]